MAQNTKHGENNPAITIQTSAGSIKAGSVIGNRFEMCQVGFNRTKPLSCGARIWVETRGQVDYT